MLECVPNVSEGRDAVVIDALAAAPGRSLLDVHTDPDHHRSVFTLAGPGPNDASRAARALAGAVAERLDLRRHRGVHPRMGVLDVVPFVALPGTTRAHARETAGEFAHWWAATHGVPVFLSGDADPDRRTLPDTRREAFAGRAPDLGPERPHPRLGATVVSARPPLVAVNCRLERDDLALARAIARAVRESSGGLPGVRALGFRLASAGTVQVSMNLVDLERTGVQDACLAVREHARASGTDVAGVELVGLLPAAELARCDVDFRAWSGIGSEHTIEARLRRARGSGVGSAGYRR